MQGGTAHHLGPDRGAAILGQPQEPISDLNQTRHLRRVMDGTALITNGNGNALAAGRTIRTWNNVQTNDAGFYYAAVTNTAGAAVGSVNNKC